MTLRHIRIFMAVCEHDNNVTRAAESLFLAQPAVSFSIRELEEYYGVKLFDRIGRRLYLTEAGRRFREYAVHITALFDEMEKGLRDWDSFGILRVGASVTIGSQFLPSYVEVYNALYPGVDVRVLIGPSEQLEAKLLNNKLDFALIEGEAHEPSLVAEEYMEDTLAVICSARGPFEQGQTVSMETFKQQRFLLREPGSGTREVFDHAMQAAGCHVIPAWEGMSTTALVNAVIHGLGITVLPQRMISGPQERGLVKAFDVEGLDLKRKFLIVYHKNKFLTGSAKAFLELCRNFEMDYPMLKYNGLY